MTTTNITIFSSLYHPFLFSFVLPAMIKFFKIRNTNTTHTSHRHHYHNHMLGLGLGLATTHVHHPPNVLESAMLRPKPNPTDKRLVGSLDDVVTGLASCTESLGFESSDEIHNSHNCGDYRHNHEGEIWRRRTLKEEGRGKVRSFPPPLPSLNRNGKPNYYLRPVRKDGRLELTEVRIERSEIMHAWRHNGRLTLHLVRDPVEEEEDVIEEEEEEEEEVNQRMRGVGGSEGGLMRCHEMVNQHQHQHQHHAYGNLRMCGISIV